MKVSGSLLAVLVFGGVVSAQSANPVVTAAKQVIESFSTKMPGSVEAMPADKFSSAPNPGQESFAHLVVHTASFSNMMCSKVSGTQAPANAKESDQKEKLVSAIQASIEFCSSALANVKDSDLGQEVELFGGRKGSKATALLYATGGLFDHYAQMAGYLRAAGAKPPGAK